MKKLLIFFLLIHVLSFSGIGQSKNLPPVDKSAMDMSYYPDKYPVLKIQDKATELLVARIIYSRPVKAGRVILGNLVKYGEVWRLGANEATEIEFYKHVRIGGKKIAKGRYSLYAIPEESLWTFILNKETDTWGSFKYDAKKDIVRVDAPVQKMTTSTEYLTMVFEKTISGCKLVVIWDNIKTELPVIF